MDYLEQLNKSQCKAVEAVKGPVMVIAGAGSGKTRVLTYRIAHIIKGGISPFNILALTFTNKAAKEMKERVGNIVGYSDSRGLWMGTFHSVFARILRAESEKVGYPKNFTIYDSNDSKNLIRSILKGMGLSDKVYKPNLVLRRISSAKSNLISAQEYALDSTIMSNDKQNKKPQMHEVYARYEKRCFQASAMDFDDLLFKTNLLLKKYPEVLLKYQERFKYIMVDEYQDTNYSQYIIVKKLAARFENLCVVGDDAQSIYAFRGANIQNIFNFKKDYPDYQTFKLEQNYRSTKNIVSAANSLIGYNKDQIEKKIWTSNEEGGKIDVYRAATDNEEGKFVADTIIEERLENQLAYNNFAVLYRTNAQSRALEEALRKKNIPYRIYGGLSFYQRKEIKDLLAYFKLIINPKDEEALKRIINYPKRGIGNTTLDKIFIDAVENDKSAWDVINNIEHIQININSGSRIKLRDFRDMINNFRQQADETNAYDLGVEIAKRSGILKELYKDRTPEGVSRHENIQELLNGLKNFTQKTSETEEENDVEITLSDYIAEIALLTDADKEAETSDHVSLMTVHMAKGLEYAHLFITGMEENLFPSSMSMDSREEIEEERRLFYVALTRAQKSIYISYAEIRYRWGNLINNEVSRFMKEVDKKYLNYINPNDIQPKVKRFTQRPKQTDKKQVFSKPANLQKINTTVSSNTSNNDNNGKIQTGMEVEHKKFGRGKVLAIEGAQPNQKATVFFKKAGQKELLLRFAKLNILDN